MRHIMLSIGMRHHVRHYQRYRSIHKPKVIISELTYYRMQRMLDRARQYGPNRALTQRLMATWVKLDSQLSVAYNKPAKRRDPTEIFLQMLNAADQREAKATPSHPWYVVALVFLGSLSLAQMGSQLVSFVIGYLWR